MGVAEVFEKTKFLFDNFGLLIVFVASFVEITPFGWTIPGGLVIAAASFFSYPNVYLFIKIIISSWIGAWFSLIGGYFLGRKTGLWFVKKLNQERNAQRAKTLLQKNGALILTSSMLANLTRFWTAYVAGVDNYSLFRFLLYSAAASLSWVSLVGFIGFLAGAEKSQIESALSKLGVLSWILVCIAIAIIIISIKQERKEFEQQDENNKNQ